MVIIESNRRYLSKLAQVVDEYRAFYDFSPSPKETEAFLEHLMDRNESTTFIAIDEQTDNVMGFINLYPCYSTLSLKRIWILNDLAVSKDFRGKGVSKALIEKVMVFAKATGAIRIELKTNVANSRAMNLYKSVGFEIDNDNVYYRVPV